VPEKFASPVDSIPIRRRRYCTAPPPMGGYCLNPPLQNRASAPGSLFVKCVQVLRNVLSDEQSVIRQANQALAFNSGTVSVKRRVSYASTNP
jgi:hypothetical protein